MNLVLFKNTGQQISAAITLYPRQNLFAAANVTVFWARHGRERASTQRGGYNALCAEYLSLLTDHVLLGIRVADAVSAAAAAREWPLVWETASGSVLEQAPESI
jgi:hypothetical protein